MDAVTAWHIMMRLQSCSQTPAKFAQLPLFDELALDAAFQVLDSLVMDSPAPRNTDQTKTAKSKPEDEVKYLFHDLHWQQRPAGQRNILIHFFLGMISYMNRHFSAQKNHFQSRISQNSMYKRKWLPVYTFCVHWVGESAGENPAVSGDSCTIGRHFDAKGRHGGQNCFERRHLPMFLHSNNFGSCTGTYRRSSVWGAMPTPCIKMPTDCAGVTGNGNS